jgi:hypothetical protein
MGASKIKKTISKTSRVLLFYFFRKFLEIKEEIWAEDATAEECVTVRARAIKP